jgi:hypothetical protein
MAEIRPIVYSKELQKQIFPDNSFYKRSVSETGVADNAETVEKPVQTKIGKAKEGNPKKLPLEIQTTTDSKKTYPVTLLYCEPLLVDSQSEMLVNYNKRQTKQEQQAGELNTKAANYAAFHWAPNKKSNILTSSGGGRSSNIVGMTSSRKAVVKDDLLKVYNLMLRMNVSGLNGKWHGLVTADTYTDLLSVPEFVDYSKTGNTSKLEQGVIGTLFGIDFYTRTTDEGHTGVLYKADGVTPLDAESTIEDTLLAGNLFWNDKMVCHAEGTLRSVINENAPGYLGGTIIESFVRFGADIVRDDLKGVITLLEAKA